MANEKLTFSQKIGIKPTVVRKPEEADIKFRPDRLAKYFRKYLDKFVFAEFSDEFLAKSKVKDIMKGIPVPLRKEDLRDFAGGEGIRATHIAENMAWIMGADPKFRFNDQYREYLMAIFNHKIYEGMLKVGRDAAEKEDFDNACIHFRATLCMQPDYLHGMYSYARVCRSMYMASSNREYVGRFKAEALEYFELLTETHPRFAQAYYYLGYAYLNLGLYGKANAAWKSFLKLSRNGKDKREIDKRRKQIKEPLRIEEGYNEILATRFENGIDILEPYLDSKFQDWWPLHYYLGVGYIRLGNEGKAVARFNKVLALNGSHLQTMEELVSIYKSQGDKEKVNKYTRKMEIIRKDLETEAEEMKLAAMQTEDEEEAEINMALEAPKTKAGLKKLPQKN